MVANLSRMNKIRSFANSPRLDRHEKPKRARVKKNTPEKWLVDKSPPDGNARTESILESGNIIAIQMSANLFKKKTGGAYETSRKKRPQITESARQLKSGI